MRKNLFGIALLFTLILVSVFTSAQKPLNDRFEVLYKVDDYTHAESLAQEHNLKIERVTNSGLALFSRGEPIDNLLTLGFVKNEKSHLFGPPVFDGDGYIADQYGLKMINMFEAWDVFTPVNQVRIAIIDTGIDPYHEEFLDQISPLSYNVLTNQTGADAVIDDHGHGTRVSGIIGALKDNEQGIAGIADFAELMIIKANQPGLNSFDDIDIIESIYYAVDNGADIINISFGSYYANPLTLNALTYAKEQGVIVVAAAGNNAETTPFYPAAFDNTLAVGSVNESRVLSRFSNYGDYIDVVAPGSNILTTDRFDQYVFANGTSLASPFVSGVLAMLLADGQDYSVDEALTRITFTATNIGDSRFYGDGLINAYDALTESLVTLELSTSYEEYNKAIIYKKFVTIGTLPVFDNDDYTFNGWFYDRDYTIPVLNSDFIEEDTTIYADLTRDYITIDFDILQMDISPVRLRTHNTYTPVDIHLDGYTFMGWYLDKAYTIPYDETPLSGDITLYAKHVETVYHDVSLWYLDTLMAVVKVQTGDILKIEDIDIDYYDINGIYKDINKNFLYLNTPIDSAQNLYLDLTAHVFKISFVSEGRSLNPVHIPYGMNYRLPQARKDDEYFVGWYLDPDYTQRFLYGNLTEDMTLYARFSEEVSLVTYYHKNQFIDTHLVANGASIDAFEPNQTGYTFEGWFYDQAFALPYNHEPINYNVVLYAKYEQIVFNVDFYDYDLETVIHSVEVPYGDPLPTVLSPHTPRHPHLSFIFNNWSVQDGTVYEDTDVYPVYSVSLKPNTLTLKPNVDTIFTGDEWVDPGLTLESDDLVIHKEGSVNPSVPGQYLITYFVYYNDTLLTVLDRNVTVLRSKATVEITLNAGHSTLYVGEVYQEAGAVSSHGNIEISHNVNTNVAGIYTVTYQVIYDGHVYEKTRFVHVIDESRIALSHYIVPKKEDAYEI